MATHRFVTAAERWKDIASGKVDTGPHISDTENTTSGTETVAETDLYLYYVCIQNVKPQPNLK